MAMNELPSTAFRKAFARLTEPTHVTVHGHVIGEWIPVSHSRYMTLQEAKAIVASVRQSAEEVATETHVWTNAGDAPDVIQSAWARSQPAPKPGQKR